MRLYSLDGNVNGVRDLLSRRQHVLLRQPLGNVLVRHGPRNVVDAHNKSASVGVQVFVLVNVTVELVRRECKRLLSVAVMKVWRVSFYSDQFARANDQLT